MGEIIDKVKEKVKDAKDKVVDTTKDVADKTKETIDSSTQTSSSSGSRQYEEGVAGTNTNRKSDPLTEYSDKEPMTPAKLRVEGPTAVKRDPNDSKSSEFKKNFLKEKIAKDWENYVYLKKPICINLLKKMKKLETDIKK